MSRTKRKVNPIQPVELAPERQIYKAAGYARLSQEDGGRPGADTIETQKELIASYIESQPDMQFCGLYSDNGRTGTNFDRPGFEQLMEDVRCGKVDCIVVKDLSRFGRNYLETGNYLERVFPFLDVRFVAVNDHFDTLTAERSGDGYIIPLKNILNDVYSKDISRKIVPALAAKRERGEHLGSWAPYGYRKCAEDRHKLEPDEETAPVVRQIFRWRMEGMSYCRIARTLNERDIPSPGRYQFLKGIVKAESYEKSRWGIMVIKTMLTNEVYLGHVVQGRKRSRFAFGQSQEVLPREQWTVVPNMHEPLIDEATFLAVKRMAEERAQTFQERLGRHDALGSSKNLLRGLIFCADCGRPLVRYKSVTRGKKLNYIFICQTHSNNPAACPKKYLHEEELLEVLQETLCRESELAGELEKQVQRAAVSERARYQEQSFAQEADAAQKSYLRAKTLYDSLYQNYVDRLMTEEEYTEMKQRFREEMEQAKARKADVERRQKAAGKVSLDNPWLVEFGRYQKDTDFSAEMAHALIERVVVDAENHISITLRYRDEFNALCCFLEESGEAARS